MSTIDPRARRHVIENVPRLGFGPKSDIFARALEIALGPAGAPHTYEQLICGSGRAFLICWDDGLFFWDRHRESPDPDPEQYLRSDLESAARAVAAAGFRGAVYAHAGCHRPEIAADVERLDRTGLRDAVLGSLARGRPVPASMSLTADPWAPEWCLLTGWDDAGDTVVGWSCFQDEPEAREAVDFEPDGPFRKKRWEVDTVAVACLEGRAADSDTADLERRAVELGVELSRPRIHGLSAAGAAAYDAWATSLRAEDLARVDDEVLRGRMRYHRHWVGHLAAQKWYTSSFLRQLQPPVWSVAHLLHAAGDYARIHELMWEIWKVAAGYWRDEEAELPKFRDLENRVRIADLIRQAGAADADAVEHLGAALDGWDRTHAHYLES